MSSSSTRNVLVNDNFSFEKGLFQNDELSDNFVTNPSMTICKKTHKDERLAIGNNLITDSAGENSFFPNSFDENGYVFDGVKIDIEDIDNTSISNITTQSLKRCKTQVLKHYYKLLCFIGWRPFYKENYYRIPWFACVFNIIYPLLIVSFLFYAYIYEIITRQGKLNVVSDTKITSTTPSAKVFEPMITTEKLKKPPIALNNSFNHGHLLNASMLPQSFNQVEHQWGYIVTTYLVPSCLHFVSYLIGFIYFRINESEQLYALMEKVFLAVNQTFKQVSQDKVIKRLKMFIFLGLLWILIEMGVQILYRAAFGIESSVFKPDWLSIFLEAVALIIVHSIFVAVVINHATQCEMILFYVNEIKTRLEEKSISLKEAMQQILDVRMAIGNLNSTVSKMTTLVAFAFTEKFMIGVIMLIMNEIMDPLVLIYRITYVISWLFILSFTMLQVVRLNSRCMKFKQIALSARVYGYHTSNRDELDSFLLFVSNTKLEAKIFSVPLKPSFILSVVLLIAFTIIILFQTSVISAPFEKLV